MIGRLSWILILTSALNGGVVGSNALYTKMMYSPIYFRNMYMEQIAKNQKPPSITINSEEETTTDSNIQVSPFEITGLESRSTTSGVLEVKYEITFNEPTTTLLYTDLFVNDQLVSSRRDGSLTHGEWSGTWSFKHLAQDITTSSAINIKLVTEFGYYSEWEHDMTYDNTQVVYKK